MSKTAPPPPTNPLLRLGAEITEEHLAELQTEIAATENRLAGMRKLERVALVFLGKTPPRVGGNGKPRTKAATPPSPTDLEDKRKQVVTYLAKNGARNGRDIIVNCGVQPAKLSDLLDHPWFTSGVQGYHITPEARRQVVG